MLLHVRRQLHQKLRQRSIHRRVEVLLIDSRQERHALGGRRPHVPLVLQWRPDAQNLSGEVDLEKSLVKLGKLVDIDRHDGPVND